MENVSFILNGREITAEYEGRMTLLKYLRNVECMKGSLSLIHISEPTRH